MEMIRYSSVNCHSLFSMANSTVLMAYLSLSVNPLPSCSTQVCVPLVLCYDRYVMGLVSAFYKWVCLILLLIVLPWWSHVTGASSAVAIVCLWSAQHWLTKKVHGCEELQFREQIIEASKFIVDSSFSGPRNEASWVDYRSRAEGVWPQQRTNGYATAPLTMINWKITWDSIDELS